MHTRTTVRRLCTGLAAAALVLPLPLAAQVDVERLDQRVRRLENILDSGQLARLIQRIDTLEQEIRQLRGEIEQQGHRLDELRERQRNLYGDLDRRLRDLEVAQQNRDTEGDTAAGATGAQAAQAAEEAAQDQADDGGTTGDAPADAARTESERDAYDAAFELLKNGRYEEAASAFATFLENHPDGPYADNAQYWLAESYYVTSRFERALEAFRGVVENYPDSAKLPDARLKIGFTLYEMGRMDEARTVLRRVIEEHGNSAVAGLAEDRLLKIERETQQ